MKRLCRGRCPAPATRPRTRKAASLRPPSASPPTTTKVSSRAVSCHCQGQLCCTVKVIFVAVSCHCQGQLCCRVLSLSWSVLLLCLGHSYGYCYGQLFYCVVSLPRSVLVPEIIIMLSWTLSNQLINLVPCLSLCCHVLSLPRSVLVPCLLND